MKPRTKRQKLKEKLLAFGYSEESIKKLFQARQLPPLDKAFALHDNFGVNINIWRDIKSYLRENTTPTKKSEQENEGAKL